MAKIKYEIVNHLATLATSNAYTKEVNLVSWNDHKPALDIRKWKNDEEQPQPLKGVTLTDDEAATVLETLKQYLNK